MYRVGTTKGTSTTTCDSVSHPLRGRCGRYCSTMCHSVASRKCVKMISDESLTDRRYILRSCSLALAMSTLSSLGISPRPAQAAGDTILDGQGAVRVVGMEVEEDLTVSERQVLEYNRRTQKQNNAPPDFPLFVREGYDMTVLTSDGYQVTPEGLIYKDYVVGSGVEPQDGQQVTFDYTAYNESAAVIDSSYRKGQPASTRLGIAGMIPGFELGIKTMKPGGKRRIIVPPELGPPVGPSTFFSAKQFEVFDVELRTAKTCTRRTIGMFSDVVCE